MGVRVWYTGNKSLKWPSYLGWSQELAFVDLLSSMKLWMAGYVEKYFDKLPRGKMRAKETKEMANSILKMDRNLGVKGKDRRKDQGTSEDRATWRC